MIPELWTFPLRFTTPAFIGGAEPNVRAELRVPSIRGALRAWYRVIVGPEVAAGLVPTHAHLRESLLFGGTGRGEGQGLASLSLEDRAPTGEHSWSNKEIRGRNPGLAYLGFSFDFRPNNRRYIASDTTFRLRVLLARGAPDDAADLLLHTLWAWVTLGGLGSRSRRGFGSLAWDGAPELGRLGGARVQRSLPPMGASLADLRAGLASLADLRARLQLPTPPPSATPAYRFDPVDGARVCLWAREGWREPRQALDAFGRAFMEFRRQRGVDGLDQGALATLLQRKPLRKAPARAAFGLPLVLRAVGPDRLDGARRQIGAFGLPLVLRAVGRSDLPAFELLPYASDGAGGPKRRMGRAPSPLLVSVVPLGAGRWGVALTLLSGVRPARDLALRERRQEIGEIPADPHNDLPERFLASLPGAQTVTP